MTTGFTARDFLAAAAMNLAWGLNIIAVKFAVEAIDPMAAAWLRQAIVLVVCLPWLRIVPGQMRALFLLGGLTGCVFLLAINLSLSVATNVSALAIAGQLGVPFSMILAVVVLGERISYARSMGVVLAIGGVMLLAFDPGIAREGLGIALQAIASFVWAVSSLVQRKLHAVPVQTLYAWIGLCGTLGLGLIVPILEPQGIVRLIHAPWDALGWVAFSAIGSTLVGHGSMSWLLKHHPVSQVVPLTLPTPVISVIVASLVFGTPITLLMVVGGVLTLVGVAIVSVRSARRTGAARIVDPG